MDISGIEKIKVNNSIAALLVVVFCLIAPLTLTISIDNQVLFSEHIYQIAGAVMLTGTTLFVMLYVMLVTQRVLLISLNELTKSKFDFLLRETIFFTSVFAACNYAVLISLNTATKLSIESNKLAILIAFLFPTVPGAFLIIRNFFKKEVPETNSIDNV